MDRLTFSFCVLAIALSLLTACQSPLQTQLPSVTSNDVSEEYQIQKKEILLQKITSQKKKGALKQERESRLAQVGSQILEENLDMCLQMTQGKADCIYGFVLVDKAQLNAYADGTKIYITPTMMNIASSDEELSLVLGHEYATNVLNHLESINTRQAFAGIIGTLLDGVAKSQGINTGSSLQKLGSTAVMARYSPELEKEADYVGLYAVARAGYDINDAPMFWRKMSQEAPAMLHGSITHPGSAERFVLLGKTVDEIKHKRRNNQALLPQPAPISN